MRPALVLAALAVLSARAEALSVGVFVNAGSPVNAKRSATENGATITLGPVYGPHVLAGVEVGKYLSHSLFVVYSRSGGPATHSQHPAADFTIGVVQYAVGYRLAWEMGGKEPGLAPYLGGGLYFGTADLKVTGSEAGVFASQTGSVNTLELHVMAGLRYMLPGGLGLRGELAGSTYGGFFSLLPSLGASWSFGE